MVLSLSYSIYDQTHNVLLWLNREIQVTMVFVLLDADEHFLDGYVFSYISVYNMNFLLQFLKVLKLTI